MLFVAGMGAWALEVHLQGTADLAMLLIVGAVLVMYAEFEKLKVGPDGIEAQRRSVTLSESAAEMQANLSTVVQALGEPPVAAADATSEAGQIDARSDRRGEASTTLAGYEAVEALLRTSAAWGWTAAKLGVESLPHPELEWSRTEGPRVGFNADVLGTAAAAPGELPEDRRPRIRIYREPSGGWTAVLPDGSTAAVGGWAKVTELRDEYDGIDVFSTIDFHRFKAQFGEPPAP